MDCLLTRGKEEKVMAAQEKEDAKQRRTVVGTKARTRGNWRPEDKDCDVVTFLIVHGNNLSHWSRSSNKFERLKYIFQTYGIDTADFQKVYIN